MLEQKDLCAIAELLDSRIVKTEDMIKETNKRVDEVEHNLTNKIEDVEKIHKKMETLLGNAGVYFDGVEYCPHHPDKGYPEENPKYKIPCNCRKPSIGMIQRSAEKYNIDLSQSYAYGDTTGDLTMFNAVKTPFAINPTKELLTKLMENEELKEKINVIVERKDVKYKLDLNHIELI